MSDPAADLHAAELRKAEAHARLSATLNELQTKLNLKALARQLTRRVADAGQSAARTSADAARRNPAPIAGVAAVGLLFLGRHRIADLFRHNKPSPKPASKDKRHA